MALPRPLHARPNERRAVLRQTCWYRRCDGGRHSQRSSCLECPAVRQGRHCCRSYRLADPCFVRGSGLQKVDPTRAPIQTALGVLGMPGMTAYIGLLEIGKPVAGETVVVAAASGAVGSVVGQIARLKGAHAIGIAGGPEKCRYVTEELGFDACIDHRTSDFVRSLAAACSKGIDLYFENVGGPVFEAVFPLLNPFARIPVCGLISMYNATSLSPGPILLPHLMRAILTKRLMIRGFIVSDFSARYGDFLRDVSAWVREGRIKYREDVVEGLENAPRAFIGLLRGENFGKLLVRVAR